MKNTSDKQMDNAKKSKGPFRTGLLVPTLILAAIIYGYFYLFFDHNLRTGIELIGGKLYGAEIDVGRIHTSFLHASFELNGLEVTDKEHPERDLVKVNQISFATDWAGLLRAKLLIREAGVLGVEAWAPRARPGWVAPPPPPAKPGSGLLAQAEDQVLQQTKAKLNQNFLGDIASVAGGANPAAQLKEIQGSLKAQARAEELSKELTAKQAEWEKRLKELPGQKDLDDIQKKIQALDLKGGNPLQMAGKLKQAKDLVDQAAGKVKQVEQAQSQLTQDLGNYQKQVGELDRLAAEDVSDLQKRMKLPGLDPKEFSTQLFMSLLEKKITGVRKYIAIARQYMPKKPTPAEKAAAAEKAKKEKEEQLLPAARSAGKTYHFPATRGYPLFWLQHAEISSTISQSDWAGRVQGEIEDVTNAPSELKRPARLHLAGDFPKQKILGLDVKAVLDHTGEVAREMVESKVGSFPVLEQSLADSGGTKLAIKSATGSAVLTATMEGDGVNMRIGSKFDRPDFQFDSDNAMVKEIVGGVLKGIPVVTMYANVGGSWDHFNLDVSSNLGTELSGGFQKALQAKLGAATAQLHAMVDEKIGPAKKKAQELLGSLSGGPGKALASQRDGMSKELAKLSSSATGGGKASPAGGLLKGFGL
jgi:uncharacterized protein (TIGR03545 family)